MNRATFRGWAVPLGLALTLVLGFRFWGQEPGGNRAYRDGDYSKAIERYRAALIRGASTPRLEYNLGTALFQVGELEEAQRFLGSALRAQDPELRASAFYNLGVVLTQSGSDSADNLRAAVEAFRRSLLLDPHDQDARWNLELAMRRLRELDQTSQPLAASGEQGEAPPQPPGAGDEQLPREGEGSEPLPQPGETEQPGGALEDLAEPPFPLELAEQILRAVEERERSLQREKLRRQRRRVSGPEW